MDDKFLTGLLLGAVGGAIIATNSMKARQIVKDSQAQVKEKLAEFKDNNKNSQD